ncbi:MAG: NUDIX domain-containing protein, partial [Verrucomicrobia bacterium]|nr:NUDIX domain-containing protein [Verrucomicrobiota bacterium]
MESKIRIREVRTLSDDWYILKKTTFDFQRRDGTWQTVSRETYDRGNGVAVLLYNRKKGTVLLTRQFRYPAYVNGCSDGLLIEACAGLYVDESPEEAIRRETQEETGQTIHHVRKVFEAYMSPGSVTEKLHFFVAEYDSHEEGRIGGSWHEGEEIEVLELRFGQALAMIADGK